MHAFPWYADIFFGALLLLTSWQTYAVGAFIITGIVLWIKKHHDRYDGLIKEDEIKIHITDTGRVWVNPEEVVKSKKFQEHVEAVKKLRENSSQIS